MNQNSIWDEFMNFVLKNEKIMKEFLEIKNYDLFIDKIIDIGKLNNFNFTEEDIIKKYRNNELKWVEKWTKIY